MADRQTVAWEPVLARVAEIAQDEPGTLTLRALFDRLVSEGALPNTPGYYAQLATRTLGARRAGQLPALPRPRRYARYEPRWPPREHETVVNLDPNIIG